MKQNVKKKKRASTSGRRSSQFFVEMDARGVLFFLTMVLLTAAVVFYLGFTFGKATRNPNDPALQQSSLSDDEASGKQKLSKKDLNIYNIKQDKKKAAILNKDAQSAMAKVDQLVKGSQSTVASASKSLKTKSPATAAKKEKTETKPIVKAPAAKSTKSGKLWTFQIFATLDETKAGDIVKNLRQRGFDAYVAQITSGGKTMYRVRVGKQTRTTMLKLKPKLEKVVAGLGIKPKLMQID
jgi:cell division septation protein DedD